MLRLAKQDNFLYYDCSPELVVYNRFTRETSLISKELKEILSIFQSPDTSYSISDIEQYFIDTRNVAVDKLTLDQNLEQLVKVQLIEQI